MFRTEIETGVISASSIRDARYYHGRVSMVTEYVSVSFSYVSNVGHIHPSSRSAPLLLSFPSRFPSFVFRATREEPSASKNNLRNIGFYCLLRSVVSHSVVMQIGSNIPQRG